VPGSRPWDSDISEGVWEATNGEGRVICSVDDEEPELCFRIQGHGLCSLITGWESVHLALLRKRYEEPYSNIFRSC
jgi:hypothetical protein